MLRNAPLLRRGALLSRGPQQGRCRIGPGSAEQRKNAAPRPGHDGQLFVACQLPLHLSPVMNPLQRPVPELPASRPPPFAQEAPTLSRTETLPLPVTPPVTLPPPADETRAPDTLKGMVLEAWQWPAWGVNVTFQVPS